MKKKIMTLLDPCEIRCEEDIAPYQILLGSILNQAIIDALGMKFHRKRYEETKSGSKKISWQARRAIHENYRASVSAHRFIMGAGLLRFLKEWKMDIKPEFFRKTYLELEKEHLALPEKGEKNVVCKRILS
jgi:hypothetical protein